MRSLPPSSVLVRSGNDRPGLLLGSHSAASLMYVSAIGT
jgi:hypothetical protein